MHPTTDGAGDKGRSGMRYEAAIDLRNANTSHALLVELVGREQTVLDIGCASGDLGRVLKSRGCKVAGVELDPGAAELAERVLDEVLIGDVGELDLITHFGKESFDVVVFGDVLEHLADPVAVLRKVLPLLTNAGAVVASIPNVAHGSVRLSLLSGRFDYRPLGLLDSTHLRFFTRGSVHSVFREAGLAPVEMRRTTVGIFDTEIDVRREEFDEGIVNAVEGDPESTTYQFVVRAVPEDSPDAINSEPVEPTSQRRIPKSRIGVWADWEGDPVRDALTVRVTCAELGRRLPGGSVRSFSASSGVRPSPHDGGLAVEALGNWSSQRASHLATELDCVIVTGRLPQLSSAEPVRATDPSRFLVEGLGPEAEVECPVMWSAVRPQTATGSLGLVSASQAYRSVLEYEPGIDLDEATVAVPDPLLLVPRILAGESLARRLEFSKIMGWFPREGPALVVDISRTLLAEAKEVARALDALVSGGRASLVLVQLQLGDDHAEAVEAVAHALTTPVYRVPTHALVDDMVAVIANASVFVSSSPWAIALGLAYERPVEYLAFASNSSLGQLAPVVCDAGGLVTCAADMAKLLKGGDRATAGVVSALQADLDAHFDEIATAADAAAAAHPGLPDLRALLPPSEYIAALQLAHHRMQERLDGERRAIADHLLELRRQHKEQLRNSNREIDRLRSEPDALKARLREISDERERVVAELKALRNIRALRMLQPARALYARLRGRRL